jgi:hypothetical protein
VPNRDLETLDNALAQCGSPSWSRNGANTRWRSEHLEMWMGDVLVLGSSSRRDRHRHREAATTNGQGALFRRKVVAAEVVEDLLAVRGELG